MKVLGMYFTPSRSPQSTCVALGLLIVGLSVQPARAQDAQYQWVNQELLDKSIDRDRYVAIGRGDLAQCSAESKSTVQRTVQLPDCSALFSSSNFFLAQECADRLERSKKTAESQYKEMTVGCMARRGWVWKKVD